MCLNPNFSQRSNFLKLKILLILFIFLFSACSSRFSIQKRKYNKGFYTSFNRKPSIVKKIEFESNHSIISNNDSRIAIDTIYLLKESKKRSFTEPCISINNLLNSSQLARISAKQTPSYEIQNQKLSYTTKANVRSFHKSDPLVNFILNLFRIILFICNLLVFLYILFIAFTVGLWYLILAFILLFIGQRFMKRIYKI